MFKQIHKRFTHNQSYKSLEKQLNKVIDENKYFKKNNSILKEENNQLRKEITLLENNNNHLCNQIEKNKVKEIKYNVENTLKNYDKFYNNI